MFLVQTMTQTMVLLQLLAPSAALAPSKIVAEKPVKLWVFSPYVHKSLCSSMWSRGILRLAQGGFTDSLALTVLISSLGALQRIR